MAIKPEVLDALLEAGASAEMIVAAIKADMRKEDERRESKRANNADRQQRHRDRRKSRKDNAHNALPDVIPPIDRTHTPSSDISPDGENQNDAPRSKPQVFPKPDWAEDQVWADWLEIRKGKRCRNTATAHAAFLADIAKHSSDDWPPGRLLAYAVARSWASIHPPDESPRNGQSSRLSSVPQAPSNRGARPDPCLDMLRAARAAQDTPGDFGTDLPTWTALPAIGSG